MFSHTAADRWRNGLHRPDRRHFYPCSLRAGGLTAGVVVAVAAAVAASAVAVSAAAVAAAAAAASAVVVVAVVVVVVVAAAAGASAAGAASFAGGSRTFVAQSFEGAGSSSKAWSSTQRNLRARHRGGG